MEGLGLLALLSLRVAGLLLDRLGLRLGDRRFQLLALHHGFEAGTLLVGVAGTAVQQSQLFLRRAEFARDLAIDDRGAPLGHSLLEGHLGLRVVLTVGRGVLLGLATLGREGQNLDAAHLFLLHVTSLKRPSGSRLPLAVQPSRFPVYDVYISILNKISQ